MILKKKVAQLCKRSKGILLATAKDKTQWVGAHSAAYSLAGMPAMSIEEVMVAFDYTEDEKAKFTTASVIDLGDLISDSYADEILVEENSKSVYFNDVHYVMYSAEGYSDPTAEEACRNISREEHGNSLFRQCKENERFLEL